MTNILLLSFSLFVPVASAEKQDHNALVRESRFPQYKRPSAETMKNAIKKLDPVSRRIVGTLAKGPAEKCGLCGGLRADAEGLHCAQQVKPFSNCGGDCKGELLLVSAAQLKKAKLTASESGLTTDGETYSFEELADAVGYAQAQRGFLRSSLSAGAVATCR